MSPAHIHHRLQPSPTVAEPPPSTPALVPPGSGILLPMPLGPCFVAPLPGLSSSCSEAVR
uniref:Uncharacterized protein n=1 Tax=Oryza barthii TaxID=65489 RepID=A0A0D3FPY6_9ORYZ